MAFITSVSIGLSTGLKLFLLFERAKIGASAKSTRKGEEKGEKETFLVSPSPLTLPACACPNFRAAKKRKIPRTGGKTYGNACCAG